MNKPSVTILALGGTIAMTQGHDKGVVPTLTGEKLVEAVPDLKALAHIDARSFRQIPSAELKYDDIVELAALIRSLAQTECRGTVITQGTDTIEETAFMLDRLLDLEMPVVVTGAMRNPTVPGADGPGNLLAAVQVAVSESARDCGCLVVMNDEIHAARFVRKTHTSRLDAFTSPLCGAIGWVSEGQVHIALRPSRIPAMPSQTGSQSMLVGLVTMALGDEADQIKAITRAGIKAMVVEAMGGGHVPSSVAAALGEAAEQIPVVLASRTGTGSVLARTYGFPGSEIDLQRRGLIRAGYLDGLKAKVLLTLALRAGLNSRQTVAELFQAWGGG